MTLHSRLYHRGQIVSLHPRDWLGRITDGYGAVIFDCDGTLVRSSAVHFAAFQTAVARQGHVLMPDWYGARTGLDRITLLGAFAAEVAPGLDVDRAIADSIVDFIAIADRVQPISETIALVRALHGRMRMAVGTNAERAVVTASLTAAGLVRAFDVVVSVSDDVRPKPAPDMFLLAAQRMMVPPAEIVVIEDSPQGVQAALAAGMDVIEVLEKAAGSDQT